MQLVKTSVAFREIGSVVGLLENLIYQKYSASVAHEIFCEFHDSAPLEIKVVHAYVQALLKLRIKVIAGILKKKRGFANASRASYPNHPVTPVNSVH